jgi:type I restriction enzyme S subunit
MGEWQTELLDDCLATLIDYRGKSPPKSSAGIPVLSAKVVKTTGLLRPVEQTIAPDYYPKWMTRGLPQPGDVVMTTEAPMGEVIQLDEETAQFALGQRIVCMRGKKKKLDNTFLRYLLTSPIQQSILASYATGTTVLGISQKALRSMPISFPGFIEQREIGEFLAALDDKIELNRRMNETLEAMARAIFKDWFVDFGPTRAKSEGGAPYLAPELWDLFPDALDDEGKPVGWTRERIGNQVVAKKGLSYKGAGLTDEANGIPLHNLNSVLEGGGYKNEGLKFYSGDYKPRHIVRPGDLIVANTEQGFDHLLIGYSALVPAWVGKEGLFSHHIFKVEPRPNSPLSRVWLHFALSASWFGEAIRRFSNGTTVNMLPPDAFEIPEIIVPPSGLVRAFEEFVEPKLRRQEDAVGESRTLAQTRDLLLPKLMSGEIRLTEAEEAVEAVA